jgi:hypothetical protein
MITGMTGNAANYLRPAQAFTPARPLTRADAVAAADINPVPDRTPGIAVSQLKALNPGPMIRADQAMLEQWAAGWLSAQRAAANPAVSDGAPQNTYAQVKVGGKVVATVFNGGSSTMTGAAAAKVGDLRDPEGLSGPNLAQWRADAYARALGGIVEKAGTAISQSQWTPHGERNTGYTRAELDRGLAGYFADTQKLIAARHGPSMPSWSNTDISA